MAKTFVNNHSVHTCAALWFPRFRHTNHIFLKNQVSMFYAMLKTWHCLWCTGKCMYTLALHKKLSTGTVHHSQTLRLFVSRSVFFIPIGLCLLRNQARVKCSRNMPGLGLTESRQLLPSVTIAKFEHSHAGQGRSCWKQHQTLLLRSNPLVNNSSPYLQTQWDASR